MEHDEMTKMQMNHFCEQVRAAVGAERAVIVTSTEGSTNLAASMDDESRGEEEVLANIISDLSRAIVSVHPSFTLTLSSPGGEPLVINAKNSSMQITQRILEVETTDGNVG